MSQLYVTTESVKGNNWWTLTQVSKLETLVAALLWPQTHHQFTTHGQVLVLVSSRYTRRY